MSTGPAIQDGSAPRDVLMVLGGIGTVQISAAVATEMFDEVGPLGATFLRSVLAAAVLLLVVRPQVRGLPAGTWRAVVPYGLVLGLMNTSFYLGIDRVPLGTAVAIEFLGPLGVGAFFARRPRDRWWVLLAALGVLSLTRPWSADGADPIGVAWLLLAAACWAAYIPLAGRAAQRLPGLRPVALAMVISASIVLVPGLLSGGGALLHGHVLLIGLVAAVAGSVVPYSLEQLALRNLAPGVFGVLMALEPGVAAVAGLVLLGQDVELLSVLGLALVIAAGVGVTRATAPEVPAAVAAP